MRRVAWSLTVLGLAMAAIGARSQPAKGVAPHARIQTLVTLDSLGPVNPGAWSPRGTWLALRSGPSQIWLLDGSHPETRPRLLFDARQWIRSATWSPDGAWLLLLIGDPSPNNERMLVAVPRDGGVPDTLRQHEDMVEAVWGPDGQVYFRTAHEWLDMPPPVRWKPAAGFTPRAVRAIDTGPGPAFYISQPDPRQHYELVCLCTFRQDTRMVVVIDALPDGSRLLVHAYGDSSALLAVVDQDGRTLLDLFRAGVRFQPTGLSSDGRLIVGFETDLDAKRGGFNHSWLAAADAGGRWVTRIAGAEGGGMPQMSREGTLIAFSAGQGTRIARLVIEGPARE